MSSTVCMIRFRAKPQKVLFSDGTIAGHNVPVPQITRRHCDMHQFRMSARFGGCANACYFPAVVARALRSIGIDGRIDLTKPLPDGVTVDLSGFLAEVTIKLPA